MPQVTIVPKYINPPKGSARSASIKDENGGYWGIHPGDMHKFQQNVPVTVEYSTSENNGKVYYNIKSIVGPPQYTQGQQQGASMQRQLPPRPPNPQADPRKSEDIFVCGVVNSAISHQSYVLMPDQLAQLVKTARWAWRNGEPGGNYSLSGGADEPPFPGSPDDYGDVDPRG